MDTKKIKILTFNVWGLKIISKFRKKRLKYIADKLSQSIDPEDDYDIVALQEVWTEEDWNYFDERCKLTYPYRRNFHSGIIAGSGLIILSKIPIKETFLYRFPVNGRPSAFFRGDWYVGKSVSIVLFVNTQTDHQPIALLNTHLHAPYSSSGDSNYLCHRLCQAWDITRVIKLLKKSGYSVILTGDLNSKPGSLPYRLITIEGNLIDTWTSTHEIEYKPEEIKFMNDKEQVELAGATCDSALNTWVSKKRSQNVCRLDFIMVDGETLHPTDSCVKFTERIDDPYNFSYSDHFAFSTSLILKNPNKNTLKDNSINHMTRCNLHNEILDVISSYINRTIPLQYNWRRSLTVISIFLILILYFLTGFLTFIPGLNVFLMILNTLITFAGITNGYICYLFIKSEKKNIREIYMEIENSFDSIKNPKKY